MNSTKEYWDILFKLEDRILYYWRISTWFNVLALGWVLFALKDGDTSIASKLVITFFYSFGYFVNIKALLKSYSKFDLFFNAAYSATEEKDKAVLRSTHSLNIKTKRVMVYISHFCYTVILVGALWCGKWLLRSLGRATRAPVLKALYVFLT